VIDHSLNADGIVEEYYVDYKDELISVPADEAKVVVAEKHGDEEEDAKKEDEEKKKKKDHDEEDEEELNSIREAYGLGKKRKGPHGEKPKLNCRSVSDINY